MHWVIQDNMYSEEGFTSLVNALDRLSLPYSVVKVIPFVRELEPDINPEGKVIVMGSYSMCYVAQKKGWEPGAFLDNNLNYDTQCFMWPSKMLNGDAWSCRFEDVPTLYAPFFIRPVDDGKAFAGTIMDWKEFQQWQQNVLSLTAEDNPTVTADTRVMVCTKKEIYSETRCWIVHQDGVGHKVVTASEYKRGTLVKYSDQVDQEVIDFANKVAWEWSPCGAYAMDIVRTPNGLKVVECNNLNSAGFYAADLQKLVISLEENFG